MTWIFAWELELLKTYRKKYNTVNKKSHIAASRIFQLPDLSYLVQVAEWKGLSSMEGKAFLEAVHSRAIASASTAVK